MCVEPVVRSAAENAASTTKAAARKQQPAIATRRPGRPKGRKNTTQADVSLTPELWHSRAMLDAVLKLVAGYIPVTYWVLDGHFGNHHALHIARQGNLPLISKRRCAAALSFPYRGPYAGRGPHRQYGHQVDDDNIPGQDLKETTVEGHIQTRLYQAQLLHKEFAQPLNVVMIATTHLPTQARAHVILFSRDLELAYAPLVDS
jgi:putative transposase